MIHKKVLLLGMVLLLFGHHLSFAQTHTFSTQAESGANVAGTSTLTDWSVKVNEFEGQASISSPLVEAAPAIGQTIESVSFKFKVASMDGGRGPAMNKKILTALKSIEHPYIQFEVTEPVRVTKIIDAAKGLFMLMAKGNLSLAGATKPIEVELEGQKNGNGEFNFKGQKKLKMSEFDIEPPSAMFGQIVTGDEITIEFDLKMAKSKVE